MPVIGTFKADKDGFAGTIRTLTLNAKVRIVANDQKSSAGAPDFRVLAGAAEIGAAWRKTASDQSSYLSVRLDDPSLTRAIALVFVPFVLGFYVSYIYRTVIALLSDGMAQELELSPADLGLLGSVFFLAFGLLQLPLGVWLDRYGPRRVQVVLLTIAAVGAFVFADSFTKLLIGRVLIGIGVAGGLTAGFKAIVLWFPPERTALLNGWYVMIGALGAVTATAPAELLMAVTGWRGLFVLLGGLTAFTGLLILVLVPETRQTSASSPHTPGIGAIYRDRRFWRIAPLSATVVGSSWALQSLWAAPWLRDVEKLDRAGTVHALFAMACALSLGALLLGFAADRLRRRGVTTAQTFVLAAGIAVLAQLALVLRTPLPAVLLFLAVAVLGAGTVLSYAVLSETLPKSMSARAVGALNVLHMLTAFAVQAGIGLGLELWSAHDGPPPMEAYQMAFGINAALQMGALAWYALSAPAAAPVYRVARPSRAKPVASSPYDVAIQTWVDRVQAARAQAAAWRWAALASMCLLASLAISVASRLTASSIVRVIARAGD